MESTAEELEVEFGDSLRGSPVPGDAGLCCQPQTFNGTFCCRKALQWPREAQSTGTLWGFLLLCKVGAFPAETEGWAQSWKQAPTRGWGPPGPAAASPPGGFRETEPPMPTAGTGRLLENFTAREKLRFPSSPRGD